MQKFKLKVSVLLFCFIYSITHAFCREKLLLYVKNLPKQPAENRLNFLFSMEYTWQKEPFRYRCIDSLKQISKDLKDETLAQYSQLLWHEYNIYLAKNLNEKAKYFKAAEQFTEESNIPELKAHLYYAIGIYDFYLQKTQTGLPLVFEAKKMLEKINYTSFRHANYYNVGFFDLYYYYEDNKMAKKYMELALKSNYDLLYLPYQYYNNIGLCTRRMKDYDGAMKYFQKALTLAQKSGDLSFQALLESNIGVLYSNRKYFKKALPYFYKDFEINKDQIPENSFYTRYLIAECLLELDSIKKAESYLFIKDINMPIWENPGYPRHKFSVMALYFQKKGNYKMSNQYKDSLIILKDSLKAKYDIKKLKDFENMLEAEKSLAKTAEFKMESERQILLRNTILGILLGVFLIIISWLLYRRKKENQIQEEKKKLVDEKLKQANIQLEQFLNNIKEKNELIEQMTLELGQPNEQNPQLAEQAQVYLEKLQKSVILTEENWQEFKSIFEKIYPNFFNKLQKDYTDISPAETRLMALQKLGLPTKEMANMLGISPDSIKKARYRFRKKYPELLSEKHHEDLEEQDEVS